MNQKKEKGITLIALVITIIVLLILAGVTINMVLGDDGIIENAKKAKELNETSTEKEIIDLAVLKQRADKDFLGIDVDALDKDIDKMLGYDAKVEKSEDEKTITVEVNSGKYSIDVETAGVTEAPIPTVADLEVGDYIDYNGHTGRVFYVQANKVEIYIDELVSVDIPIGDDIESAVDAYNNTYKAFNNAVSVYDSPLANKVRSMFTSGVEEITSTETFTVPNHDPFTIIDYDAFYADDSRKYEEHIELWDSDDEDGVWQR